MYEWIYIELLTLLLPNYLLFQNVCSIEITCDKQYLAKNNLMCFPCSAGYFKVSDCVKSGEQARCQPCRRGEYMPDCDNSPKCANCGSCSSRQVIVKNCSTTGDIECQCKDGYYWQPYASYCKTYSKCGKGLGLAANGTPFEDTICVPCKTGVSYSDRGSFDACTPCSSCTSTSTVITECSVTQNVVCSDPKQHLPRQNKKLDDGILASIILSVAALVIIVVVIACILKRKRRRTEDTNNTGSSTVKSPGLNEEENCKLNSSSDSQSKDISVSIIDEKYTLSQNVTKSESESCSDYESYTESTVTDCNESDIFPVKSNVCHQNNEENDPQTDRTANKTKANNDVSYNIPRESQMQKKDLKEEIKIEHAQNDKSKDFPMSDDESSLPTPLETPENDNNSKGKTRIEPCNYATEQETATTGDLDSFDVSLDVVDVSPRGSVQSQELSRNSEETSLKDGITPEDQNKTTTALEQEMCNEIYEESQEGRPVKFNQSDDKVWFDAITFIASSLKWADFNIFVRILVAMKNEELLKTIDVVVDHARVEENNICKSIINNVMAKWRQATPKATVDDLVNALEESQLNLVAEQLAKKLSQKLPTNKVLTPSCPGLHNEMCRNQSRDIDHVMENLKAHELQNF